MGKARVLIIDDAAAVRRLLAMALAGDPELEVVGMAANGRIGLQMIQRFRPDVLVLDLVMPEMDGPQVLRAIAVSHPKLPVVVFSALTHRGAIATLDALALGAKDYLTKPTSLDVSDPESSARLIREQLAPKLKALCGLSDPARLPGLVPGVEPPGTARQRPEVVAIGVSTGGPNALAAVLSEMPGDFPAPVLIVQHMPPIFTRQLAERLDSKSALDVSEAVDGQVVRPGQAVVAPGGLHLVAERHRGEVRVAVHQEAPENSCRPAADVLFRSVAHQFGPAALALVMTGMGQDGLCGSREIRRAGGQVLAQDRASSVVWGMPGYVVQAGLADRVLPLDQLAAELVRRARGDDARGRELA